MVLAVIVLTVLLTLFTTVWWLLARFCWFRNCTASLSLISKSFLLSPAGSGEKSNKSSKLTVPRSMFSLIILMNYLDSELWVLTTVVSNWNPVSPPLYHSESVENVEKRVYFLFSDSTASHTGFCVDQSLQSLQCSYELTETVTRPEQWSHCQSQGLATVNSSFTQHGPDYTPDTSLHIFMRGAKIFVNRASTRKFKKSLFLI